MRSGIAAILNVVVLVTFVTVLSWPAQTAIAVPAGDGTEDILYLEDGRILHGSIISEERTTVVFEYVNTTLNMRTKLNFSIDEIVKIERDVPLEGGSGAGGSDGSTPDRSKPDRKKRPGSYKVPSGRYSSVQPTVIETDRSDTLGVRRGSEHDENLLSLYIVPMEGQMGTDIAPDVYELIIEDIRQQDPDLLIIQMKCLDSEDRHMDRVDRRDKGRSGIGFLDIYREVLNLFQDDLRDIPQVCWIHDSVGISSILALSWDDLYMTPDARLGGLSSVAQNFDVADADVHGKFREAYMAVLRSFVEYADYDLDLVDAMVRPELKLGATWKGRDVEWDLRGFGQYLLDDSEEATVNFKARSAEHFCISDGTAETLDDVALLHGIREYRLSEGSARDIFDDYREDWRRAYKACETAYRDYLQFIEWANGEDQLKYLGKAKSQLTKVMGLIKRYDAVERRLGSDFGIGYEALVTQVEVIREQIRQIKRARGRGAGGGRPPAGGGGGRGPGSR